MVETQTKFITKMTTQIYALVNERMAKLESQEANLKTIVSIEMYSFMHYLRKIKTGFTKWAVLNRCVKELHPAGLSLIQILSSIKDNQALIKQREDRI